MRGETAGHAAFVSPDRCKTLPVQFKLTLSVWAFQYKAANEFGQKRNDTFRNRENKHADALLYFPILIGGPSYEETDADI